MRASLPVPSSAPPAKVAAGDRNPAGRPRRLQGLYGVLPAGLGDAQLLTVAEAALAGGARLLQLREKSIDDAGICQRARLLRPLCDAHGALLIVNDRVEAALAAGADGVHLGRDDADPRLARQRLGHAAIIGVSCYADAGRAAAAVAAGADYVAFGAAFASPTKPQAPPVPLATIAEARAALPVAVAAIGGITVHNAPRLLAVGVDLLAVVSDLFSAPDITARARQYQSLFDEARR
jgi:thiamine-phosphate pyrophosphorylase